MTASRGKTHRLRDDPGVHHRARGTLRPVLAAVLLAASPAVAGCTNAPPPTRERTDYALAADRICTQLEDAVGPPRRQAVQALEAGRPQDAARFARRAADAGTALLDRLAGLRPPPGDAEDLRAWVADLRAQQQGLRRLAEAIAAGDAQRATRINREINDLARDTRRFAFDFGMQTCSK